MPAARFLQDARLASEDAASSERESWRVAAFIGWQVRTAVSMGGKQPDFKKYLKQLGLHEPKRVSSEELRREKEAAAKIGDRVREAFQHGVKKADI